MQNFNLARLLAFLGYLVPQIAITVLFFVIKTEVPGGSQQFAGIARLLFVGTLATALVGVVISQGINRWLGDGEGVNLDTEPLKLQFIAAISSVLCQDIPPQLWQMSLRVLIITALLGSGTLVGTFRKSPRVQQALANGAVTLSVLVIGLVAGFILHSSWLLLSATVLAFFVALYPSAAIFLGGFDTNQTFEEEYQRFEEAEQDIREHSVVADCETAIKEAYGRGIVTCYFTIAELVDCVNIPSLLETDRSTGEVRVNLHSWLIDENFLFLEELVCALATFMLAQRTLSFTKDGSLEGVMCHVAAEAADAAVRAIEFNKLEAYQELLEAARKRLTAQISTQPESQVASASAPVVTTDENNGTGSSVTLPSSNRRPQNRGGIIRF